MISKEETHDILNNYPIGSYLDTKDFEKIYELLLNHPKSQEKIGCGLSKIGIEDNAYGHRQFFLLRIDKTKEHFSYVKCYSPMKLYTKFSKAMRINIRDQVRDFKIRNFRKGISWQGRKCKDCNGLGVIIVNPEKLHLNETCRSCDGGGAYKNETL